MSDDPVTVVTGYFTREAADSDIEAICDALQERGYAADIDREGWFDHSPT